MPADLIVIGQLFVEQAKALWPYFLGGVLFAAFIKTFKWDRRIRASLVRYRRAAIPVAVAAGLVSPLCSCGILPVVLSLSAAGVPLPPVLALLVTSPLMSPDAFLITVGQLGWTWAMWKLAAAAVVGLAAGYLADGLMRRGILSGTGFRADRMYDAKGAVRPGFEEIVNAGCFTHAAQGEGPGGRPSAAGALAGTLRVLVRGEAPVDRENRIVFFLERLRDMVFMIGKYLLAALLIEAAVTYYVPVNRIEPLLGRESALSILLATLVAVPLPLHQVAAPSVIKGLLAAGMSPGAGMAMLIGGPVTSIPAISALAGLYERRAFLLYLGIGFASALACGYLFQAIHG